MDAIGTLGVALAGGSAGALITLVAGIPQQIRHHNRQVKEFDEDLSQWVADQTVSLERTAEGIRNEYSAMGQYYSGAYLTRLAHAKEDALHRFRDQLVNTERKRSALRDDEGWRHAVLRRFRYGQLPELRAPAETGPLIELWRVEIRRNGDRAPVSDPTKRSLRWALDKYISDETLRSGWPSP